MVAKQQGQNERKNQLISILCPSVKLNVLYSKKQSNLNIFRQDTAVVLDKMILSDCHGFSQLNMLMKYHADVMPALK